MSMLGWLIAIAAAYLIGSIPFGVLIARSKGVDIRAVGSGNIGATNVGRTLGKPFGVICFVLDFLKGAAPVLVAGIAFGVLRERPAEIGVLEMALWLGVAVAAVVGHMASLYLRFAGGKGVATGFGAIAAMWPLLTIPALAALVTWFIVIKATRYVSVASMAAAASLPIWYVVWLIVWSEESAAASLIGGWPPIVAMAALAGLIVWRHRGNIARLRRGEETKVGAPKE
jgi:glycerol-3-phosphate acyltransferase PlsY